MGVFGRVAVGRVIATQRPAARLTGAQMDPLRANLDALIAFAAFRISNRCDGSEMRARFVRHGGLLFSRKGMIAILALEEQPRLDPVPPYLDAECRPAFPGVKCLPRGKVWKW
jgi:hypothetical protein